MISRYGKQNFDMKRIGYDLETGALYEIQLDLNDSIDPDTVDRLMTRASKPRSTSNSNTSVIAL